MDQQPAWLDPLRLHTGGDFLFTDEPEPEPIWGHGDEVLWHTGEGLLLVGPTGVGKTTLTIQLVLALMGLRSPYVLGYKVNGPPRKVLYLAGDRPAQFRRAMLRCVSEADRDKLNDLLVVWRGPAPKDIARNTSILLEMAQAVGADVIVIDSLKDVAARLSDDETGNGFHQATQLCLVYGIEVLTLHHQRKGQEGRRPTTLEDVYGSIWIPSGSGSVIILWGDAGAPTVEFTHLKQPAGTVGPFTLEHDHLEGRTRVINGKMDILGMISAVGTTALEVASKMYATAEPSDSQRRVAYRKLEGLVQSGALRKLEVHSPNGGKPLGRYLPVSQWIGATDTGVSDIPMDSDGQSGAE